MKEKKAIFPGSFDPFTRGHHDIVCRGLSCFDHIVISIGYNSSKSKRYFSVEYIIEKIEALYKNEPRVSVQQYNELTSSFAKHLNATFILRGLRNTTDFEYENTISQINHDLYDAVETVYLITSPQYAFISSSIVRELYSFDSDVSKYVPYELENICK